MPAPDSAQKMLCIIRELKHQTFLAPRTPTGRIFAAWQLLRMSKRSWAAVTDFKTRVLRLKPVVQILGSSKSIRHTKVKILRLKSCFLRRKETNLNPNLWKTLSTELFCRRSWWFYVVFLMICIWHANRVPNPVLRGQPCRSWIKNVWCLSSLLCRIGEQFLLSSFREFVHDGYCLATLARFVYQACACKGNF